MDALECQQVWAALAQLTPGQREFVIPKYLEGWENADIAALLDKPVGAVKALQHRASDALRRQVLLVSEKSYE